MIWSYRNIPTVDIYFRSPLAALISEVSIVSARRPIRRIGPHSFVCSDVAVIVRYLTPDERRALSRIRPRVIHYVLDDDLFALADDTSLPEDYRARLARFSSEHLPWILDHADEVIAPSEAILGRFPRHRTALLHPSYTTLCRDFSHFGKSEAVNILFPGTRSHLADLAPLADGLRDLVERDERVTMTTFLGEHAPRSLRDHPRLINRRAEKWPRYRRFLVTARFHMALAPNADTAFNVGRSINKVFDVAAVGAAGLYSARPPSARVVTDGVDGLLLGDDPATWLVAIERLSRDRQAMEKLARSGAALAEKYGNPEHIRSFWRDRLPAKCE